MAKASFAAVNITTYGDGMNEAATLPALSNTASPAVDTVGALINGNLSLTTPAGCKWVTLSSGTIAFTIKGAAGDTGLPCTVGLTVGPLPIGAATAFVLTAAGVGTVDIKYR